MNSGSGCEGRVANVGDVFSECRDKARNSEYDFLLCSQRLGFTGIHILRSLIVLIPNLCFLIPI